MSLLDSSENGKVKEKLEVVHLKTRLNGANSEVQTFLCAVLLRGR